MAILNTHSAVKNLMRQGFTEGQAESFVEIVSEQNNQLATKEDISVLKNDVSELKGDVSILKRDIAALKSDVKRDIAVLRAEFKMDISELKSEVKMETSELKGDIMKLRSKIEIVESNLNINFKWMMGTSLVILGLIIPLYFK